MQQQKPSQATVLVNLFWAWNFLRSGTQWAPSAAVVQAYWWFLRKASQNLKLHQHFFQNSRKTALGMWMRVLWLSGQRSYIVGSWGIHTGPIKEHRRDTDFSFQEEGSWQNTAIKSNRYTTPCATAKIPSKSHVQERRYSVMRQDKWPNIQFHPTAGYGAGVWQSVRGQLTSMFCTM